MQGYSHGVHERRFIVRSAAQSVPETKASADKLSTAHDGDWDCARHELLARHSYSTSRFELQKYFGKITTSSGKNKSNNLQMDEKYRAKVADFGLSKLKHDNKTISTTLGAVPWMSPEVIRVRATSAANSLLIILSSGTNLYRKSWRLFIWCRAVGDVNGERSVSSRQDNTAARRHDRTSRLQTPCAPKLSCRVEEADGGTLEPRQDFICVARWSDFWAELLESSTRG